MLNTNIYKRWQHSRIRYIKEYKYQDLSERCVFVPISMESHGMLRSKAISLLTLLYSSSKVLSTLLSTCYKYLQACFAN